MFGLKYSGEFFSQYENIHWRVEIAQRGYDGAVENLKFVANSDPLILTWEKQGDEFYVPIKASEAKFTINCDDNFKYLSLFTSDPRYFRVSIFRNTRLYWRGFIVSDLYSEQFSPPPYDVVVSAVDGFNLLNSVPFLDQMGNQFRDHNMSLWAMIQKSYDLLELDIDIADWSNMYADGMFENISPLKQVFVDTSKIYAINEEATYRDALEIALTPFAYQLFQSNGALHIRSVESLYSTERPLQYWNIGGGGKIVTHNAEPIITHMNEPIITSIIRERLESMWDGFNVQSTATLEVVPAIKDLKIEVANKLTTNIATNIGLRTLSKYTLSGLTAENIDGKIWIKTTTGTEDNISCRINSEVLKQTTLSSKLTIKIKNTGVVTTSGMGFARTKIVLKQDVSCEFGGIEHIVVEEKWVVKPKDPSTDTIEINFGEEKSTDIDLPPLPQDGTLKIALILQGDYHIGMIVDFSYNFIDQNDVISDKLIEKRIINNANNINYDIKIAAADLVDMPNNTLLYEIYLKTANDYTKYWHKKGSKFSSSIIENLAVMTEKFRGMASKKITGNMHTGRHVDLNTVLIDEKYIKAGFHINSMVLDAYNDDVDCELVELPALIEIELDELVILKDLNINIACSCAYGVLYLNSGSLRFLDLNNYADTVVVSTSPDFKLINSRLNGAVAMFGGKIYVVNYRGQVIASYDNFDPVSGLEFHNVIELRNELWGVVYFDNSPRPSTSSRVKLSSPTDRIYLGNHLVENSLYSRNTVAINYSDDKSLLEDQRVVSSFSEQGRVLALTEDYFVIQGDRTLVYQRVNYTDKVKILEVASENNIFTASPGVIAYSNGQIVNIYYHSDGSIRVINNGGEFGKVRHIMILAGYLYVVRVHAIIRYILH